MSGSVDSYHGGQSEGMPPHMGLEVKDGAAVKVKTGP